MCILFLAIKQHPKYPVIICANRDEFHERPTQEAHFWHGKTKILAGKDLKAGGSWLGINSNGSFAAITNIRNGAAQSESKRSRGELVTSALHPNSQINLKWLVQNSDNYNAFNLIYGSLNHLVCYNSALKKQTSLSKGFYAISNGPLEDVWPKMAKGQYNLEQLVETNEEILSDQLFGILKDQSMAPESELPNTGIPHEWEKKLSSIFIQSHDYGTRSSTVIKQNNHGMIDFYERAYGRSGTVRNESKFALEMI